MRTSIADPNPAAMFPLLTRLLRERHETGRCGTWELWSREAAEGLDRHWPISLNPRTDRQRQEILEAYRIAGELIDQLISNSVANDLPIPHATGDRKSR